MLPQDRPTVGASLILDAGELAIVDRFSYLCNCLSRDRSTGLGTSPRIPKGGIAYR